MRLIWYCTVLLSQRLSFSVFSHTLFPADFVSLPQRSQQKCQVKAGMGKRAKVPVALQSELTEYHSLLRALRASSTLDLSSHLVNSQASSQSRVDQQTRDLEEAPQSSYVEESSITRPESSPDQPKRDTWTRWPLLVGDTPVPEWQLKDEVRVIASRFLRALHLSDEDGESGSGFVDEEDGNVLAQPVVDALANATSSYLSKILAAMAELHRPSPRLANRIRPYDWQAVLDVVNSNGLIDKGSVVLTSSSVLSPWLMNYRNVEDLQQRLSIVMSGNAVASQASSSLPPIVSQAFSQLKSTQDDSLFVFEGYTPPSPPKGEFCRSENSFRTFNPMSAFKLQSGPIANEEQVTRKIPTRSPRNVRKATPEVESLSTLSI